MVGLHWDANGRLDRAVFTRSERYAKKDAFGIILIPIDTQQ